MMTLSRRRFLQLSSAALVGLALPNLPISAAVAAPTHGFALSAAPVFAQPDSSAALLRHLWPESVTPLQEALPGWYRLQDGYVQQDALHPLTIYPPQPYQADLSLPTPAQVCGTVATLHQTCAADAPIVGRRLHSEVAFISDQLPGEPQGWYQFRDSQGNLLGWSQATVWNVLPNP